MTIRALAFDADGTLWDTEAAIARGLARAVEVVGERHQGALVTTDLLTEAWRQVLDEAIAAGSYRAPGAPTLPELRRASIARALAAAGIDDPETTEVVVREYFARRHGTNEPFPDVAPVLAALATRYVVGLVTNGNTRSGDLAATFSFRLAADEIGLRKPDPRLFAMAAAAAGCHPNELVSIGDDPANDVVAPQALGCRTVLIDRAGVGPPSGVVPDAVISTIADLPDALAAIEARDADASGAVGVGPHPEPWPDDPRLDRALLAEGDRRNVVDRYRYWSEDAIVADLASRRHGFHVAVENWQHDRNIGAVIRNANAFGAAAVHIVGRRRWNRRGAMATDRYLEVVHHDTVEGLLRWCEERSLPVVAIDNVAGSVPIETTRLPASCVLAFGQEGPGLSDELLGHASVTCAITQHGSTRSINAGVASGIAMHAWLAQHVAPAPAPAVGWPAAVDAP